MTATPADVDLCLRLYEQRRDRELRRARDWMMAFAPASFADVKAAIDGRDGRKANRYWRMATSYWEMVAALMMSGGVTPAGRALFAETTREFFFVFAKIRPFLADVRSTYSPFFFRRLEEYCLSLPEHDALQAYFEKRRAALGATAPKGARAPKKK